MNDIILLSTSDVCKKLGVNRVKLQQYRNAGLLKGRKFGRGWCYLPCEVEEFLKITSGVDISSPEKIEIAGAIIRESKRVSNSG